jgi:hypothetical protein
VLETSPLGFAEQVAAAEEAVFQIGRAHV